MSSWKFLRAELGSDHVAVVELARPPVNAVHREMYIEVAELFRDPDVLGEDVRAIVLTGSGKHFCAGNDLDEFATMTPENGTERMWRVREAFFAIQDCPVPVIAAVHGAALGTGLAIAAACDFAVASEDALFGLPELSVGVMGGARHLARIAPEPLVRRMFFTGEQLPAGAFQESGGSVIVVPRGQLLASARAHAVRVASFSPNAVRIGKRILNRVEEMNLKEGYQFEQGFTVRMSGHPDSKEALRAVREKRTPSYRPRRGNELF